jgi:hydrogenase small subunit
MEVLDRTVAGEHGDYLLVVEGGVPTGEHAASTTVGSRDGHEQTALGALGTLAETATGVVAVGTCSAFGGIPAARGADTGSVGVAEALDRDDVIAVPGCPPHPLWIASTLLAVEAGAPVDLDGRGRPLAIFGPTVHDGCPRRAAYERSDFAVAPGDPERCFYQIGCKGPWTHANCAEIRWHDGRTFCIDANHPCVGCAAPGFVDRPPGSGVMAMSPVYDPCWGGRARTDDA